MKNGILYSFLNISCMLNQCINFVTQILNVNYYESLVSRCNLTGVTNSTCFYYNNNNKKGTANSL